MVHEVYPDKDYWTLPGGGIEDGETGEMAAVREIREETTLNVRIKRFLFSRKYEEGTENCYLVEFSDDSIPELGFDPELPLNEQVLKEVRWKPLIEVRDDVQVPKVID